MQRKLGRLPRAFNHKIPHMSAILQGTRRPAHVPASVNYAPAEISNFGMMLNDQLGDCTCAAFYHALQIWSMAAQHKEITEPDSCVLSLYEKACGYNPNDPNSDQGGVEQNLLEYVLKTGAPMAQGATEKILAFYEVDPRMANDVKQTIYECGLVYIGFSVPASLMGDGAPPAVWKFNNDEEIVGGHAIILTGYDAQGLDLISWGEKYRMDWPFFHAYVDEVYGIVDPHWLTVTGKTPLGMTAQQLEALMKSL